jgi:hypothetical protein
MSKMKLLCESISRRSMAGIILKLNSNTSASQIVDRLNENKVKLDFIIMNTNKNVSHMNIFNISSVASGHFTHFIVVDDLYAGETNAYTANDATAKYAYYQVNGEDEAIKFIQGIKLANEPNAKEGGKLHMPNNVVYPASALAVNKNEEITKSGLILEMIKIK